MKLFECQCGWKFVLGKKKFYGPLFEDNSAETARIQPIEDFAEEYSDCHWHYEKTLIPAKKPILWRR